MKRIVLITLAFLPLCSFAQRKPKIKGSRIVTEVREDLPAFNAVELNDDLEIKLKKSFGEGYEIIADDNLVDILKFKVADSTLIISSFYTVTAKKKMEITVNFKELKAITLRDGKMTVEDVLDTDNLYVNTFGTSRLNLNASAFNAHVNMENSSKADFNLDVDSLSVSLKDKTDAIIYSVSSAKNVELFNTSSVKMEGTTDTLNLKMYGNTKFNGQQLEAGTCKLEVEESVSARVYAFKELELRSRDNAKTYLYGDPSIRILEFLNTSQLLKREN